MKPFLCGKLSALFLNTFRGFFFTKKKGDKWWTRKKNGILNMVLLKNSCK